MEKSINKYNFKYYCEKCDYGTSIKCNFNKHLSARKHQMVTNDNKKYKKTFFCENCKKTFAYKSGLSRHKKKCDIDTDKKILKTSENEQQNLTSEMLKQVMEQNSVLQQQIIELSKKQQTVNYNTHNNNKMTINVFLNEICKDAINLTEFLQGLNVSLDDLMYTKENGYAKGISNIVVKHLTHLKPTERPIHCSDKKRLQFYVKDEDKWEKDDNKLDKTIDLVSQKQIQQIKQWEQQHPKWNTNEKETEMYLQMIKQVMGGESSADCLEIKKGISGALDLKNAMIEED